MKSSQSEYRCLCGLCILTWAMMFTHCEMPAKMRAIATAGSSPRGQLGSEHLQQKEVTAKEQ